MTFGDEHGINCTFTAESMIRAALQGQSVVSVFVDIDQAILEYFGPERVAIAVLESL